MRRRMPPLNSLRAFEVVSRHESFRAAAQELHVTAAAVSQQMKLLEDHLGRKLLRRRSGGYSLTADALAGLRIYAMRLNTCHRRSQPWRLAASVF